LLAIAAANPLAFALQDFDESSDDNEDDEDDEDNEGEDDSDDGDRVDDKVGAVCYVCSAGPWLTGDCCNILSSGTVLRDGTAARFKFGG
jgi:hypothetical protein